MKRVICGFGIAALIALAPPTPSADLFDNGGPLCSVLSIGCPPPPPPPPAPEPVAAPEKPVRHVRKAKVKAKAKAKTENSAEAPPATEK